MGVSAILTSARNGLGKKSVVKDPWREGATGNVMLRRPVAKRMQGGRHANWKLRTELGRTAVRGRMMRRERTCAVEGEGWELKAKAERTVAACQMMDCETLLRKWQARVVGVHGM